MYVDERWTTNYPKKRKDDFLKSLIVAAVEVKKLGLLAILVR